jgi:hypothetical protein
MECYHPKEEEDLMRLTKIAATAASAVALSLVSAPVVAQTNSTSSTVSENEEGLNQLSWVVIFGVLALAIGLIVSGGSDNDPVSP